MSNLRFLLKIFCLFVLLGISILHKKMDTSQLADKKVEMEKLAMTQHLLKKVKF
jgi:hypothetical protein